MAHNTPDIREENKQRLNFMANVVRSGLFASASDILAEMRKSGMPGADIGVSVINGAAMFTAELVHNSVKESGGDIPKAREFLLATIGEYFDAYCEMAVREAASAIVSHDAGIQ